MANMGGSSFLRQGVKATIVFIIGRELPGPAMPDGDARNLPALSQQTHIAETIPLVNFKSIFGMPSCMLATSCAVNLVTSSGNNQNLAMLVLPWNTKSTYYVFMETT
ncbi:hypothetical protein [Pseudarthrobacter sp. SSS035]|uniref:hypothetical protein n=1 Tax=Pseudarthrobacter sp. SSS035 TaxID=2931399 RepID=UPI00200D5D18|nr:hypothetical protein [Pseudarthrobacter sp. SSS035]